MTLDNIDVRLSCEFEKIRMNIKESVAIKLLAIDDVIASMTFDLEHPLTNLTEILLMGKQYLSFMTIGLKLRELER